jgi:hypothetical protein
MKQMLIEVHIIQNHAPSNLNRDDSGSPKSAIFGGYRRARISSQCLKRCYRTSKTFRDEVDALGMHTRAMPEEIKFRLRTHAAKLKLENQTELKAKFEEWAEKCQDKLASILGKSGKESKANDEEDEGRENEADVESENEEENADETEEGDGKLTGRSNKLKTAQSIFWREMEIQALLEAYRVRIEWDKHVPEAMRKAFNDKNEVKPSDMLKAAGMVDNSDAFSTKAKAIYDEEGKKLQGLNGKAKTKEEKRVATKLANLILERFDPKLILSEAGLRPDGIPVDMALFGRMIASPRMHNIESSSQFAHAISTHEFAREFDLWTRVDDRRDKRLDYYRDAFGAEEKLESGTDGMGDAEFTSACYYSYFNVDFCALIDNLTGKALNHKLEVHKDDANNAKDRACKAVVGLLKAAIFERPTGKFNSMATPSLPTLVLVEVRDSHVPVSYADAFAKPVDPKNEEKQSDTGQVLRVDLPKESAKRLIREANRITKAFKRTATARLLFTGGTSIDENLDGKNTKTETDTKETIKEIEREESSNVPFTPIVDVDELVKKLREALEFKDA